jgi:hypothetical protein
MTNNLYAAAIAPLASVTTDIGANVATTPDMITQGASLIVQIILAITALVALLRSATKR